MAPTEYNREVEKKKQKKTLNVSLTTRRADVVRLMWITELDVCDHHAHRSLF